MNDQELELKAKKRAVWQEKWRWGFVAFVVIVASVAVIFFFLRFQGFEDLINNVISTASPIIIGLVIGYLLNPIVKFLEEKLAKLFSRFMKNQKKIKSLSKGLAITITIVGFILIIVLLIWSIVPALVSSISGLVTTLPDQVSDFIKTLEKWEFEDTPLMQSLEGALTNAIDYIEDYIQNDLLKSATSYVTMVTSGVISVAKGIFNFIIGIIVAIYVLLIKDTLRAQSKKLCYAIFKPKAANAIIRTARKSNEIFGGFISGKIIDSFIIGIIAYIGCLILNMPQALLIAVMIGVTNIIPVFGPFIGAIPSLFIVVIQSPIQALYLLIFIIILQQVDGNIIGPKILGNSTGLSTFWVMFAILVGSALWGFVGMLIGVPLFGVIYYILKQVVEAAVKKKKLPTSTLAYTEIDHVDVETNEIVERDLEAIKREKQLKREESRGKIRKKIDEKKDRLKNESKTESKDEEESDK